jgi:hypothetical protein
VFHTGETAGKETGVHAYSRILDAGLFRVHQCK